MVDKTDTKAALAEFAQIVKADEEHLWEIFEAEFDKYIEWCKGDGRTEFLKNPAYVEKRLGDSVGNMFWKFTNEKLPIEERYQVMGSALGLLVGLAEYVLPGLDFSRVNEDSIVKSYEIAAMKLKEYTEARHIHINFDPMRVRIQQSADNIHPKPPMLTGTVAKRVLEACAQHFH